MTPSHLLRQSLFSLALLACGGVLAAPSLPPEVLASLAERGQADVLLVLAPAPLPPLSPAVGPAGQRARTQQIVAALQAHAQRSQAQWLRQLSALGAPAQPLWLGNRIATRLGPEQLQRLLRIPGLQAVESDAARQFPTPRFETADKAARSALEPHLTAMRVAQAWALGARGRGVVIGGQDTGYDFTHPALRNAYRGAQGVDGHDYHWYDGVRSAVNAGGNACGYASALPCDDGMHGTHTMGIALGDGGEGARIGVATEAQWIGCRNMDRGIGRPSTYLACFQFLLAPTRRDGSQPRPELAPSITINSWGCPLGAPPQGEDCSADSFDAALAAAEAAGQLTVVAAGNGNPFCGSIRTPPSTSAQALVVGATDNLGTLAPFSLWGPVSTAGGPRLKPDLVAPGSAVRSSVPGGQYAPASGTSMATPGVAGVAALMLGANPLLIAQPQATAALLKASAVPALHAGSCPDAPGQQSPNPMFGYGRVDALAAVQAALQAVGPAHSGAWFDPARPGEGWILQILDAGTATLVWYSFGVEDAASQAWFIASEGVIEGSRIRFDSVSAVHGGRFGAAFQPSAIQLHEVGALSLDFSSCTNASLSFSGRAEYPDQLRTLTRLTSPDGRSCGQPHRSLADTRAARSGAWFDPARPGEGWLIEALEGEAVALTWFSFDPEGRPAWLFGLGSLGAGGLRIEDLRRLEGGRFGADFDPTALRDSAWGSLQIDFTGCDAGTLHYAAADPAWGSDTRAVQRLTRLFDSRCAAP
jgi:subtilisin family serine protease